MGVYLVTNITDSSEAPREVRITDIPNRVMITLLPGETVDFEIDSQRNQILESAQLKVHHRMGYVAIDTLGTSPDPSSLPTVNALITSGISVGTISLDEPIAISALVGGIETSLTAVASSGKTALHVNELLPDKPTISRVLSPGVAMSEFTFTLPVNTKQFRIRVEQYDCDLYIATASGGSFSILKKGSWEEHSEVNASSLTLYLKTEVALRAVVIWSWAL